MKEVPKQYNLLEEQHILLKKYVRPWEHERIIPVIALKLGDTPVNTLRIKMGYAIVDEKVEEKELILEIEPNIPAPSIEWQEEKLKKKIGRKAMVSPVQIWEGKTQTAYTIGWRVESKDQLPHKVAHNVRETLIQAASYMLEDHEARNCSDAELCIIMILIQHRDVKRIRSIVDAIHRDRVADITIYERIYAMIDEELQNNKTRVRYSDPWQGRNPI